MCFKFFNGKKYEMMNFKKKCGEGKNSEWKSEKPLLDSQRKLWCSGTDTKTQGEGKRRKTVKE